MATIIIYDDYASSYCSVKFKNEADKVYEINDSQLINIKELLKPIELNGNNYEKKLLTEDEEMNIIRGEEHIYIMTEAELCPLRHIIKTLIGQIKYMN